MATDTSSGKDESGSTAALLGKCFAVGLVLGILGVVVYVGSVFVTGYKISLVGLVPALVAGYGIRKVAGDRAGALTGLVAVVTGQGPVLLLYYVAMDLISFGKADAAILMFGFLVAYKIGNGPDEESGSGTTTVTDATAEDLDPADVDNEAVAEALEGDEDVDLDDLADALAEEESTDGTPAMADAGPAASDAPTDGDPPDDDESADEDGTASDWVNDD